MLRRLFVFVVLLFWLAGCSREVAPEPVRIAAPDYIGVVDRVYSAQKYVLIRMVGVLPEPGATLISQSPEGGEKRIANLLASPERLGNVRIPADIRSGSVLAGDLVFVYKGLAAPAGKTEESGGSRLLPAGKENALPSLPERAGEDSMPVKEDSERVPFSSAHAPLPDLSPPVFSSGVGASPDDE